MNDLDGRIRAAVRDSARMPLDEDVMASVAGKRARRRAVRRVEAGALAVAAVVALVVASVVVLGGGDDHTTRVAAPPARSSMPKVRVVDADGTTMRAATHFVALDADEGYVRGPLIVQGDTITAAAYDRSGKSFTFPPSRIVRFTLDGHVLDRVDLKGEILSLTQGEGARWALTRDKVVLAPPDPEFRVKRIGSIGQPRSNAVPRGEQPVGDLFAGGGAVWLPVTDGVLRFDPATGEYRGKIQLTPGAAHRAIAVVGKAPYVTDGGSLRALDAASATPGGASFPAPERGVQYVDVVSDGDDAWVLAGIGAGDFVVWQFKAFGGGMFTEVARGTGSPEALDLVDGTVWVHAGTARGAVLLRADDHTTVQLGDTRNAETAALASDGTVVFTRGGAVFRTRVRG